MIDAPGPWGSGPFVLSEGYSSLENEVATISADPFTAVWLDTAQLRSDRMVLTANTEHWNTERIPYVEWAIFLNDMPHDRALELVCTTEGEVDIVTEVDPSDAQRVTDSEYANLEPVDAMRVVVGIINRGAGDVPLGDIRARQALNLAVDRDRLVREGFAGYAYPLAGLTPHFATGFPEGLEPYPHDPEEAKRLLSEAGWPEGRALRLACDPSAEKATRLLAEDYEQALGIDVEVTVVPEEDLLVAQHTLIEKVMPLPFDVLVQPWFDLTSDAPPAVLHREFYFSGGALRAGPPVPEFENLMGRFATEIDPEKQGEIAAQIDRFVYDQALSVFLCSPQALYAVNRHVKFVGHATTFELAETEVDEEHWSRRGESDGGSGEESPGVTERIKQAAERLTGGSDGG